MAASAIGSTTGAYDAISATWSDISVASPQKSDVNEDNTITFTQGSTRAFSIDYVGEGLMYYRLNSGSYVIYTVPFNVSSGTTVGWQYKNPGMYNETVTVTVTDNTRGSTIDSFDVIYTGGS